MQNRQIKISIVKIVALSGGSPLRARLSVDDFFTAVLDGNLKNVEKYMRQNPNGKKDGDHDNPFYIAYQLAKSSGNSAARGVIAPLLRMTTPVKAAIDAEEFAEKVAQIKYQLRI